eukprot:3937914-Rhodomonas_salina.1
MSEPGPEPIGNLVGAEELGSPRLQARQDPGQSGGRGSSDCSAARTPPPLSSTRARRAGASRLLLLHLVLTDVGYRMVPHHSHLHALLFYLHLALRVQPPECQLSVPLALKDRCVFAHHVRLLEHNQLPEHPPPILLHALPVHAALQPLQCPKAKLCDPSIPPEVDLASAP